MLNRRSLLAAGLATMLGRRLSFAAEAERSFVTRGVVLVPEDLTLANWPQRARRARLTTIGIHHGISPAAVMTWIKKDEGQRFLEACRDCGLHVEYELHAMKELLPRLLFEKNPELFRVDEKGNRNPDANCCAHAERALELIAENAVAIATVLRPTTGRYFFWGDDGLPWCHCARCKHLLPSEQALRIENRIIRALKGLESRATLAHLAYDNTLKPPIAIRPDTSIFLEYAPIHRRYDIPYRQQTAAGHRDGLPSLDANLQVFPVATAQVLEYWLDVSRFSSWKRPAVALPWRRDVLVADLDTYSARGIRRVTSFAVYVDAEYRQRHAEPAFIQEYGDALLAHQCEGAVREPARR